MTYWIINSLIVFVLCVLFAGVLIPQILLIAYRRNLFDEVDERKIHKGAIPRLGGMAFEPVILLSLVLMAGANILAGETMFSDAFSAHTLVFIAAFCSIQLLYLVGLADDLIGIKYRAKFVIQLVCAVLLISSGCWFDTLGGALGINAWSPWIGMPFTAIVIVFIINAFNLIDGIDGLASGLSSIASLIYGISFLMLGEYGYALISFATLGVLVPFYYFNVFGDVRKHSKIFMGDTGSLTIGLILSILGIQLYTLPDTDMLEFSPSVLAFSPLIIPAFDVVRVYMMRIRQHRSPFLPDKSHIHHKFLAAGMRPRVAMVTIIITSVLFTLLNLWLSVWMNINVIVVLDIVLWIAFNGWLNTRIARYRRTHSDV
ncbi:MAG: undecaprenyl/decaprenyl-phosphate alpha-N-acetylglucosaminyl 1-phosphate transferase [Muribaculaceae bacterium]|nr:undecaprenyl/decaprenyl-phosphate alpha-N-acetylglucosaminyl 1-phosphate transferase [Muribaculaceae bacterium]